MSVWDDNNVRLLR